MGVRHCPWQWLPTSSTASWSDQWKICKSTQSAWEAAEGFLPKPSVLLDQHIIYLHDQALRRQICRIWCDQIKASQLLLLGPLKTLNLLLPPSNGLPDPAWDWLQVPGQTGQRLNATAAPFIGSHKYLSGCAFPQKMLWFGDLPSHFLDLVWQLRQQLRLPSHLHFSEWLRWPWWGSSPIAAMTLMICTRYITKALLQWIL